MKTKVPTALGWQGNSKGTWVQVPAWRTVNAAFTEEELNSRGKDGFQIRMHAHSIPQEPTVDLWCEVGWSGVLPVFHPCEAGVELMLSKS